MSGSEKKSRILSKLGEGIYKGDEKKVGKLIISMKAREANTVEAFLLLCDALAKKYIVISKMLLNKGVKFELTEEQYNLIPSAFGKDTPLNLACKIGNEEIVKMLVDKGADINFISKSGFNALSTATKYSQGNIVKYLLEKGATVNNPACEKQVTPLYAACENGNIELVKLFLSKGADINRPSLNGFTDMTTALCAATKNQHDEIAKLLVEEGAHLNDRSGICRGYSALHLACFNGNEELVKLFLSKGANGHDTPISFPDRGYEPIHSAAAHGHIKIIEIFLQAGISVDSTVIDGPPLRVGTPLHVACSSGKIASIRYLLSKGASINSADNVGDTPLHRAVDNNKLETVKYLINKGANINLINEDNDAPIHLACRANNEEMLKLILSEGKDIKLSNNNGCLPLHLATQHKSKKIIDFLMDSGADVNCTDSHGNTPLHHMTKYMDDNYIDTTKILDFLVQRGADVNAKNALGETPLHRACKRCFVDYSFIVALLNHGAKINEKNRDGITPLQVAILCCNTKMPRPDVIDYLIFWGADIESKENTRKTALHMAYMLNIPDNVNKLLEYGADINKMFDPDFTEIREEPDDDDDIYSNEFFDYTLPSRLLLKESIANFKWADLVKDTLINHIVKLKSLHLYVNEIMFGQLSPSDPKISKYAEQCEAEVEKMKNEMFDGISLYTIFTKPDNQAANYLMNSDIVAKLQHFELGHYPIYGNMLGAKLKKIFLRMITCRQSFDLMNIVLGKKLSSLCLYKIMEYLSTKDLANFVDAYSENESTLILQLLGRD